MNLKPNEPCIYCHRPADFYMQIEPANVRKNVKGQLVIDQPLTVAICVDCRAGVSARMAEDAGARYRAQAAQGGHEQLKWC